MDISANRHGEEKHKLSELNLVELVDIITRYIGDLEARLVQEVEKAGLTMKQMLYVTVISTLGRPTLGELAKELGLSKPSVTSIVEKLVSLGYLVRVPSDEDRRSAYVRLTALGEDLARRHDDVHREIAGFFENSLERSDLEALTGILNRAVRNIST